MAAARQRTSHTGKSRRHHELAVKLFGNTSSLREQDHPSKGESCDDFSGRASQPVAPSEVSTPGSASGGVGGCASKPVVPSEGPRPGSASGDLAGGASEQSAAAHVETHRYPVSASGDIGGCACEPAAHEKKTPPRLSWSPAQAVQVVMSAAVPPSRPLPHHTVCHSAARPNTAGSQGQDADSWDRARGVVSS